MGERGAVVLADVILTGVRRSRRLELGNLQVAVDEKRSRTGRNNQAISAVARIRVAQPLPRAHTFGDRSRSY